jgi:hypothetical protein
LGSAHGVHALHIHLDELGESVLIQIQNKVVYEVEAVANDYEGNLIGKFGLLQEVLDLLGIIVIGLPADSLNLTNLTRPCSSLDVLEVNLRVIAQVNDRTKVIIESLQTVSPTHMDIYQDLPSKLLNDSNISMSLTAPRMSEYLVAIWTTTCRFWRIFTRNISFMHAIDCSVVRRLK